MKRKNLIFQVVSLFAIVGLIAVGCQKNDNPEASVKKFTLGFDVQQPDAYGKKAIDNENIPQYYGSACNWTDAKSVVVGYTVLDANDNVLASEESVPLNILKWFEDGGVATELLQVEFTDDKAIEATLTVNKFMVYNDVDGKGDAIMATPVKGSAFDGYVDEALSVTVNMEQYTKERKLVEVLCFQPDDYLEFGFTWFDFEIVEGFEYCAFFNCINSTDPENYHGIADVAFDVYEVDGGVVDGTAYYSGTTTDVAKEVAPSNCIPVPGSYQTAIDDQLVDETVVMMIVLQGGLEIPVTVGDISSYEYGKFAPLAAVPTFGMNHDDLGFVGFDYEIVGNADGENIVHYQLDVCP